MARKGPNGHNGKAKETRRDSNGGRVGRLMFSGYELAKVRHARELTVEELGERAGIDPRAVAVFEGYFGEGAGDLDVAPTVDQVLALADALDVEIGMLCVAVGKDRERYEALQKSPKSGNWRFSGAKIRAARLRRGYSIEHAAHMANVPEREVQYVEDDESEIMPSFMALRLIAELDRRPLTESIASYLVRS